MNTSRLLRTSFSKLRTPQRPPRRRYATDPAPHPPSQPPNPNTPPPQKKEPSRVGTFYRNNTYPVLKAFLGALFTYQLAYYAWLKLEVVEEKHVNNNTIEGLKQELKSAVAKQKESLREAVDVAKPKPEEEGKKKRGWW
ncbi:hypothetical protein N0V90_003383 [Kalmusia sp. IMI 367209]|nr:hypothetical protein N0V90_003383 [Kalmusia sp. IMI 367209]